jgi:hypothetical protein
VTKSPEAKTATVNKAIVIKRKRSGVRTEPNRCPSQTRIPLAALTVVAAPIMHCTHMARQPTPAIA